MPIFDEHAVVQIPRPRGTRRTAPGDQFLVQIRYRILAGELRRGERLPPVRQIAAFLRINRNTVAHAYRRLKAEGYLTTDGRRGTFVRRDSPLTPRLADLADRLLLEAAGAGLTATELHALLSLRAPRRLLRSPRVGFVECNNVDLVYFRRLIERDLGRIVRPVLLSQMPRAAAGCDLLVTTLFHVEEVQRLAPACEVLGLAALPDFRTLREVSSLPRRVTVALICATEEGLRSRYRSLGAFGLAPPRLMGASLGDPRGVHGVLNRARVLLASPKVLERLRGRIPAQIRVIPFASRLNEGALIMLRERLERTTI